MFVLEKKNALSRAVRKREMGRSVEAEGGCGGPSGVCSQES